jgi:DNA polymerase V
MLSNFGRKPAWGALTGTLTPLIGPRLPLPLMLSHVQAGFPSPAEDYVEGQLDLNEHLIHRPAATFFVHVTGESMTDIGIYPGDLLIVDRAEPVVHGKVVVAVLDGGLTVKLFERRGRSIILKAANPDFSPIVLDEQQDVELIIWGVATSAVRRL